MTDGRRQRTLQGWTGWCRMLAVLAGVCWLVAVSLSRLAGAETGEPERLPVAEPGMVANETGRATLGEQSRESMVPDEEEPLEQQLRRMQDAMAQIRTVQADYVQTKQMAVFDRELVIQGRMAVETPGRVAWQADQPLRYRMVIEGHRLTQWDEETDRVQTLRLDRDPAMQQAVEQMTVWFSGRYLDLLDTYDIKIEQKAPYIVQFKPIPGTAFENVIALVQVTFCADNVYLRQLEITEGDGSITTIEFLNARVDEPIPDDMWQVRP